MRQFFLYYKKIDWILIGLVSILLSFGLATIYGIELAAENPDFSNFYKQLGFVITGLILVFLFSRIDYKAYNAYYKHIYIVGIVLLLMVLFFGQTIRGTRGWFQVAGFGIQPVEFVKVAVIIFLAHFFSKVAYKTHELKTIISSALMVVGVVLLVLFQPDFGSALTVVGVWLGMLLVVGIRKSHALLLFTILVSLCAVAWLFVFQDYQKERIMTFLDPSRDPLGRGYNITQATIAVGSGQLLGRGLGYGSQSQLKFLPESQTDFIFAVIAEEFGFVGCVIIIILWAMIFWRLVRVAKLCKDDFGSLLAIGVALLFFIQIMVNIGMNIGLMPVTGISLPFISYGGSFLLISLFGIGIVQSVSARC